MQNHTGKLQLTALYHEFDELQMLYGASGYNAIYGAGEINRPKIGLVFMNPTARNVSAHKDWEGIRAPWLGTKDVWKMLHQIGLFKNDAMVRSIAEIKPEEWTPDFAFALYDEVAKESIYITNIAKCTQKDACHVRNSVYKDYRTLMLRELDAVQPEFTFTFGNQVSTVLLGKRVSVSDYLGATKEDLLSQGLTHKIFPTYYPVGQGRRNMGVAVERIKSVLAS